MFVDSDDWVEPDYCEKALKAAVENHVSCVVFGVNNIVEESVAFYSKQRGCILHYILLF